MTPLTTIAEISFAFISSFLLLGISLLCGPPRLYELRFPSSQPHLGYSLSDRLLSQFPAPP